MQKSFVSVLIVLLGIIANKANSQVVKLAQSYNTNPQRSQTVNKYCIQSRSQMFTQEQQSMFSTYGSATQGEINLNGDQIIKYILQGKNNQAVQLVNSNPKVYSYFVFFIIGLVVFIVLAPFLICCCICPDSCPPCSKCRHPKDKPYSKISKCLPFAMLIVLLLIVIGCMIASLVFGVKFTKSYEKFQCSFAIFFDDTLNGNVTIDQNSYFIGVVSFNSSISKLNSSLSDMEKKIQPISTNGTKISKMNNDIQSAKQDLKNIPDGAGGNLILEYGSPLNEEIPTKKVNSTFPMILGNATMPPTLVGKAAIGLALASVSIQLVSNSSDKMIKDIGKFRSSSDLIYQKIGSFASSIRQTDKNIDNSLTAIRDNQMKSISTGFYLITSFTLIFAIIMLVSVILMLRNAFKFRNIMYVACFFLFILGILTFILSLLFSLTTIVSYFGCSYVKNSLQSPAKFQKYIGPAINDKNTVKILSQCVPTGNGDILSQLIGNTSDIFSQISNFTDTLLNYNQSNSTSLFEKSYSGLTSTIQNYQRAKILDLFPNSPDIKILQMVSNPSNFTCSSGGFNQDSWIPSVDQQPPYISCKIQNGPNVTNGSCANFSSRNSGCVGCFDSYSVFEKNSTAADIKSALLLRYPELNCLQFTSNLSNVWNNFYKVKKDAIGPVLTRSNSTQIKLKAIKQSIYNDISPSFRSVLLDMQSTYSSITDKKYGLIAGLNCRVIGEDINLIVQVTCNSIFVYSYLLRIMFAVTSFALCFIMCFTVCAGVRNNRQQKRLSNERGDQPEYYSDKDEAKSADKGTTSSKGSRSSQRRRRRTRKQQSAQELKHIY